MEDLFRFVVLRPPAAIEQANILVLDSTFCAQDATLPEAAEAAGVYVGSSQFVRAPADLDKANLGAAVFELVASGQTEVADIKSTVEALSAGSLADLASDQGFADDIERTSNSLVAMKLLSDSSGADAPALANLIQGYDAIRQALEGRNPVYLRPITYSTYADPDGGEVPASTHEPSPEPQRPELLEIAELEAAMSCLRSIRAEDFKAASSDARRSPRETRSTSRRAQEGPTGSADGHGGEKWLLSGQAAKRFPSAARKTLERRGLDLEKHSLPFVLTTIHHALVKAEGKLAASSARSPEAISKVGVSFGPIAAGEYVGLPTGPFPTSAGSIKPVGVGDLLLVKQHTLRYEGGELAHIENVLRSEHLSRETRRLDRTETTVMVETEQTKEEVRDTQTTDRFSLKREVESTIATDTSLSAGVEVSAKYGPFVEVKANANYSTSTSTESSARQSAEFSKDLVARSVSKLVDRVLQRRTVTNISEFEEKYTHTFDNHDGPHVSGYYQWVDKVVQAQIYNYGKRLLFDVAVPEPGTSYILLKALQQQSGDGITKPVPFDVHPLDIWEWNYTILGQQYDATGLEPPPAIVKTVVKAIEVSAGQSPYNTVKSESVPIEAGYAARYAQLAYDFWKYDPARLALLIGTNWIEMVSGPLTHVDLIGETGAVGIAHHGRNVQNFAATIEILCERTERAFQAWQLKTHDTISQAYLAKLKAYEQEIAEAEAAAMGDFAGQNPLFNRRIISGELRRQCISLVTGQTFDGFGALEVSSEGYAQPNFASVDQQMPYVRFFEQAFEWNHIAWTFYPYFWGWKPAWKNRALLDDVDPEFGDFLRAGAARVVLPVRPGFEAAVLHFLETSNIWNGGPPPDVTSPMYVPIVKEIQEATGAPGNEVPEGEPWTFKLPTTLVRLRPADDLPEWQKVGEEWLPSN